MIRLYKTLTQIVKEQCWISTLSNETVIRGKRNLNEIVYGAGQPPANPGRIHQSISQHSLWKF